MTNSFIDTQSAKKAVESPLVDALSEVIASSSAASLSGTNSFIDTQSERKAVGLTPSETPSEEWAFNPGSARQAVTRSHKPMATGQNQSGRIAQQNNSGGWATSGVALTSAECGAFQSQVDSRTVNAHVSGSEPHFVMFGVDDTTRHLAHVVRACTSVVDSTSPFR